MFDFLLLDLKEYLHNNTSACSSEGSTLEKALHQYLPESAQILNVITIIRKELYSKRNVNSVKLYSYENIFKPFEEWEDESRPLFLYCEMQTKYPVDPWTYRVIYSKRVPPDDAMNKLGNLFDWRKPFGIGCVNKKLIPGLLKLASKNGGAFKPVEEWAMYLPLGVKAQADEKKQDSYVKVRRLLPEHASFVNAHWDLKDGSTLYQIGDSIKHSITAGAFLPQEPHPVSWIISLPFGTLNALYTLKEKRRNGYAERVLGFACCLAEREGIIPFCEVEKSSPQSKFLLEKIGFQIAFEASWMPYEPGTIDKAKYLIRDEDE